MMMWMEEIFTAVLLFGLAYLTAVMSMEIHTLRAVKVTKNIIAKTRYLSFELRRVNKEIEEVSRIMESLERKKTRLENSF